MVRFILRNSTNSLLITTVEEAAVNEDEIPSKDDSDGVCDQVEAAAAHDDATAGLTTLDTVTRIQNSASASQRAATETPRQFRRIVHGVVV